MMLLCVDGIDPDLVYEWGWDKVFKHNYKLEIPQECFVPDVELGSTPHTTRVWATIFSGQKIDYGLTKRTGFRKTAHDALVRSGITWKRGKSKYTIAPVNENLDTIFKHYDSFYWNIPTISPEWIASFPGYDAFVKYCGREHSTWIMITTGMVNMGSIDRVFELEAYYTRFIDFIGHNDWKRLKVEYADLFVRIEAMKKLREDIVVISDHGCKDGLHTNYAYMGSDVPMQVESVDELRATFELLLDGPFE